jgi:hypothetical protein
MLVQLIAAGARKRPAAGKIKERNSIEPFSNATRAMRDATHPALFLFGDPLRDRSSGNDW